MTDPTADEVVALKGPRGICLGCNRTARLRVGYCEKCHAADALRDPRPPATDAGEMRKAPDAGQVQAFGRVRMATYHAQSGRYQGHMRSDDDEVSVKVGDLRAILTLLSPTFLAENAKNEGFREGVEASAALVDEWTINHHQRIYADGETIMRADFAEELATAIRALPDPAQAVGEKG